MRLLFRFAVIPVISVVLMASPPVGDAFVAMSTDPTTPHYQQRSFPSMATKEPRLTTEATTCQATASSNEDHSESVERSLSVEQTAGDNNISPTRNLDAYNLLWSPGAWKKIVLGTFSLALANMLVSSVPAVVTSSSWLQSAWQWTNTGVSFLRKKAVSSLLFSNLLLPLAASSCCLLQLGINLLAGGCAGFNTVLGPIRPYFLSLLLWLSATTITTMSSRRGITTLCLRWSIALLPEALDLWNRYYLERPVLLSTAASVVTQEQTTLGTTNQNDVPSSLPIQATVSLSIPTMGCVACINTIDSALRQTRTSTTSTSNTNRILQAASSLNPLGAKGGQARVKVQAVDRQELDQLVDALVRSVQAAGFESCQVDSVRISSSSAL